MITYRELMRLEADHVGEDLDNEIIVTVELRDHPDTAIRFRPDHVDARIVGETIEVVCTDASIERLYGSHRDKS